MSSRRTPGPIRRGPSFKQRGRYLLLSLTPVVMGPGVRGTTRDLILDDGELADDHRGQTGAAAAATPEMAIVRQARNDPDDALRGVVLRLLAVGDVRHRHA